jgi:hypothetical protein
MRLSGDAPGDPAPRSLPLSSMVMTLTVTPQDGRPLVRISTTWEGAGGIGGLFERLFAPQVMRGM